jgi:hypothetical protein
MRSTGRELISRTPLYQHLMALRAAPPVTFAATIRADITLDVFLRRILLVSDAYHDIRESFFALLCIAWCKLYGCLVT